MRWRCTLIGCSGACCGVLYSCVCTGSTIALRFRYHYAVLGRTGVGKTQYMYLYVSNRMHDPIRIRRTKAHVFIQLKMTSLMQFS
ncbi:hypothetical protein P167DRAFT_301984 [Morchella conica CCBAS932]|uniref:Uncharacterized protein n=1 Tax=Morchella conica CCBAS932 TaxID=1392247 RepID=A0A3N4KJQ9_9PEZI|nr:hypothetical protein P167DRAFT_301984 [Morchella conica CCBAS932]